MSKHPIEDDPSQPLIDGPAAESPDPTAVLDTGAAGGMAIRGSALRAGGYGLSAILTLASAPFLFRHLGVVEFGRYSTVLSLVAVVAGVTEAGLGAVAVREYSVLLPAARAAFMSDVLGARLLLTVAGIVIACGFATVSGYGADMVAGTALAGFALVIAVYQGTLFIPYGAGLRYGWITVGDLARAAIQVVLVLALVVAGSGLVGFLAVPIPVNIALLALTAVLVRGLVPFRPRFRLAELKTLLRETLPLAAAAIISTLYFRVVLILMAIVASGYQTGLFATSYRIVEVLNGLPALLIGATFPVLSRAARDDDARLGYALQRVFEVSLIGGGLLALGTIVGAETAVAVLGGAEAAPADNVLEIQAFALLPLTLTVTWTHALLSLRRHRDLLVANAIGLSVVLTLTMVLVPILDARGAAMAVAIGEISLATSAAILVKRARGRVFENLRVVPKVALAVGTAVVIVAVSGAPDAVETVLAVAAYLGVLIVTRAIPPELLGAFRRPGAQPAG